MLEPLVRSKQRLFGLLDTVCPQLPAELAEDYKNAIWRLIYHYDGLSQKWALVRELEKEFCSL